ncbi:MULTISPECIES: TetR/AcrR family transcriptional regulator [Gordonia]|uniref:TetR/AcrR family transcriptional regulator n=1 Tax=Gordonia oleivorans TaxID=3156618 RepID=UPI0032B3FEAD
MVRPKSPLLDPGSIARAALAALDDRGSFTMPGIAKDLGVAVSSLYHHIPSREYLLELIRGSVAAELAEHVDWSLPWTETVRQWLISYRNAFGAHPELVRALTAQTVRAPEVLEGYDRLADKLFGSGFHLDRIIDIITLLDTVALGSALDLAAPEEVWAVSELPDDSTLARAARSAPTGVARADSSFAFAVDLVISGLERELV